MVHKERVRHRFGNTGGLVFGMVLHCAQGKRDPVRTYGIMEVAFDTEIGPISRARISFENTCWGICTCVSCHSETISHMLCTVSYLLSTGLQTRTKCVDIVEPPFPEIHPEVFMYYISHSHVPYAVHNATKRFERNEKLRLIPSITTK
jgi:hypothetical protein